MREEEAAQQVGVVHRFQHRLAGFEVHAALVVIANFEGFSQVDDSFQPATHLRPPATCDQVQESGFPGGVPANYANALIALEVVSEVLQVALVLPPETHSLAIDYLVAQVGALHLGLTQVHLLLDVGVVGPLLDVPEGLLAVLGLAGAGAGAGMHPFQLPPVDIAHLLRLCVVIVYPFLALFQEVHVVTAVDIHLTPVHFHDNIAHTVKEIAVMGNHEQGTAAVLQMGLQKFNGVNVQVVGGLVHNVEVGLTGKHPGERHPLDLAAGKVFHEPFTAKAKLVQQPVYPEFILPLMVRVQMPGPFLRIVHNLVMDRLVRVKGIVLLQKGNAYILEKQHLSAAVRGVLPGQYPKQGSLSRSVGRNERHLVPFIDIEINVLKQHLGAVTLGNVLYLQVTGHRTTKIRKK